MLKGSNEMVEVIGMMVSVLTLILLYERFCHDKKNAINQQRLVDLQVELHKHQINKLKSESNG